MDSLTVQIIIAFVFGVVFVITLVVLAIAFPKPTSFQYNVFRIVLSLAASGVAAMIPGFINVELKSSIGLLIRAGGALAVFVVVYFFNPAQLALKEESPGASAVTLIDASLDAKDSPYEQNIEDGKKVIRPKKSKKRRDS